MCGRVWVQQTIPGFTALCAPIHHCYFVSFWLHSFIFFHLSQEDDNDESSTSNKKGTKVIVQKVTNSTMVYANYSWESIKINSPAFVNCKTLAKTYFAIHCCLKSYSIIFITCIISTMHAQNSKIWFLCSGGGQDLLKSGYANAARFFFRKSMAESDANGDYFPIWGTCLGFEELLVLAMEERQLDRSAEKRERERERERA